MKFKFIFIILTLSFFVYANDSSYIVIFAGGKTKADALNAIKKWESSGAKEELPQITPVALLSDTIEGLNPGFNIAVAGNYDKKDEALKVKNKVNEFFKGTYVRKIATNQDLIFENPKSNVNYEYFNNFFKFSNIWVIKSKKNKGKSINGRYFGLNDSITIYENDSVCFRKPEKYSFKCSYFRNEKRIIKDTTNLQAIVKLNSHISLILYNHSLCLLNNNIEKLYDFLDNTTLNNFNIYKLDELNYLVNIITYGPGIYSKSQKYFLVCTNEKKIKQEINLSTTIPLNLLSENPPTLDKSIKEYMENNPLNEIYGLLIYESFFHINDDGIPQISHYENFELDYFYIWDEDAFKLFDLE